jgi:hypothetical protein
MLRGRPWIRVGLEVVTYLDLRHGAYVEDDGILGAGEDGGTGHRRNGQRCGVHRFSSADRVRAILDGSNQPRLANWGGRVPPAVPRPTNRDR